MNDRVRRYSLIGLKALRISASTVALVELLRTDWSGAAGGATAWLLFIQVERRWTDAADLDT